MWPAGKEEGCGWQCVTDEGEDDGLGMHTATGEGNEVAATNEPEDAHR